MSGIVGGYSVNNWLAASAAGYGLTSANSLMDIGKSKAASSDASNRVQASPHFPDPFAANAKRIDLAKRSTSATNQLQSLLDRAQAERDKERFNPNAISAQAQSLAAIQPPQITFSSADFAMLMEERDSADMLGQKSAKQSGGQLSDAQPESSGNEAENDGDGDDNVVAFSTSYSAQSNSSNDALSQLHALFQTANTAYAAALHPPMNAAISLIG